MTKDDLLRMAYELLWHEHRITSVEVGEAFGINETYHKDSCDVCDLLREIDKLLEHTCGACNDCPNCTIDCCSDCESGKPIFLCNCEGHECDPSFRD